MKGVGLASIIPSVYIVCTQKSTWLMVCGSDQLFSNSHFMTWIVVYTDRNFCVHHKHCHMCLYQGHVQY